MRGAESTWVSWFSFAGNSTYPKTQNLRDVAKALPLENILIETDAPYLAPQPYRGKRNEPAYVAEVARTLATVRDLTPEQIAAATTENFGAFLTLPNRRASRRQVSRQMNNLGDTPSRC